MDIFLHPTHKVTLWLLTRCHFSLNLVVVIMAAPQTKLTYSISLQTETVIIDGGENRVAVLVWTLYLKKSFSTTITWHKAIWGCSQMDILKMQAQSRFCYCEISMLVFHCADTYAALAWSSLFQPQFKAGMEGLMEVYCMMLFTSDAGYVDSAHRATLPNIDAVMRPFRWLYKSMELDCCLVDFSRKVASSFVNWISFSLHWATSESLSSLRSEYSLSYSEVRRGVWFIFHLGWRLGLWKSWHYRKDSRRWMCLVKSGKKCVLVDRWGQWFHSFSRKTLHTVRGIKKVTEQGRTYARRSNRTYSHMRPCVGPCVHPYVTQRKCCCCDCCSVFLHL